MEKVSQNPNLVVKHKKYHASSICPINQQKLATIIKRYQSQELDIFRSIDKNQIFQKVEIFMKFLIQNEVKLNNIIKQLNYDEGIENYPQKINKDQTNIQFHLDKQKINIMKETRFSNINKINKNLKKISILTPQIIQQSNISPWTSAESLKTLSLFKLPEKILTLEIIKDIYEKPQAFLINLSVCLFLKFVKYEQIKVTEQNVCWILAISTIVAYKIYYDEPVEGLVQSFSYILDINKCDIVDLEIYFLNAIEHRALISSQQYHLVLSKLILL